MHQPQYRNLANGEYLLPWSYLHAIKDYADMVGILEEIPEARAVVNFSPIMLEQIADYDAQIEAFFVHGTALRDLLLATLAGADLSAGREHYSAIVRACLRVNEEQLINRFPHYRRLADLARFMGETDSLHYLSEQYLADILVWYHLAWMGETVRQHDERIKQLIDKAQGYTLQDRLLLLSVIGELIGGVLGRYRALVERRRIEVSMTPDTHPILPLLIDFDCARDAMPDVQLPLAPRYPGGLERARRHINDGKAAFQHYFGHTPRGCWPSEGGVSRAAVQLLAESGFAWCASGEKVLHNSRTHTGTLQDAAHTEWLYRPYQVDGARIACFFRDDGLSDLIGFTYAKWHSDDAVNNFIHHLENIADACAKQPDAIVSIIMDGENAWEYYPNNAYYFLTALYKKLTTHKRLNLTTFSSYLEKCAPNHPPAPLADMVAGSWVYGTFSTWIGDPAKNRGWDLLCEAKQAFDAALKSGRLHGEQLAAAERQLAVCEGSDWFWWFGDYNPAETVSDFEKLYRLHLSNLYRLVGVQPPADLFTVISAGGGAPPHSGTMRPSQ